jgi:carboxypeptidase C (cathepsin A)
MKNAPQLVDDQSPLEISTNNDQRSQHIRKELTWINVYEVTGIKQSNDSLPHFALFSYYDIVISKDIIKEIKWKKALDDEIDVIKKSNTRELIKFLKGLKTIGEKWKFKVKEESFIVKLIL